MCTPNMTVGICTNQIRSKTEKVFDATDLTAKSAIQTDCVDIMLSIFVNGITIDIKLKI